MTEVDADMQVQPPTSSELQLYQNLWRAPARKRDPSPAAVKDNKSLKTQTGKSQQAGRKGKGYPGKSQGGQPSERASDNQHQLVGMLARLAIRHEDALSLQRADRGFCLFLRTADSEETITRQLFLTSQKWKENRTQQPQARRSPLRVVLFSMVLQALQDRAIATMSDEESRKKAIEAQLIKPTEDGKGGMQRSWIYLAYDPNEKKEMPDLENHPMDHERMIRRLKAIQDQTHGEMILRFHGLRPLSEEMEGEQYLMVLEISQSSREALQMLADLRDVVNSSIWKLVGARFRKDRIQRSPLAVRLSEMIKVWGCSVSCRSLY